MWTNKRLQEIVNETVISVTKKMAGISLSPCPSSVKAGEKDWSVLKIAITGLGDGDFSFYYRAQPQVYRSIAEHMKRAPVDDVSDMEIYIKEYFNILCGNIISKINREIHSSMRFGIPDYYEDGVITGESPLMRVCYECVDAAGAISITGVANKAAAQ